MKVTNNLLTVVSRSYTNRYLALVCLHPFLLRLVHLSQLFQLKFELKHLILQRMSTTTLAFWLLLLVYSAFEAGRVLATFLVNN